MHNSGAKYAVYAGKIRHVVQKRVYQSVGIHVVCRVHSHALWLVDYRQVLVLVDNVQWDVLRGDIQWDFLRQSYHNFRILLDGSGRFGYHFAIDGHTAIRHYLLYVGASELGVFRKEGIQSAILTFAS